jgi:mRNA interferase YafQ
MRELRYTTQFERDFKRLKKDPSVKKLETVLTRLIEALQHDSVLAPKFLDHALLGGYKDCRECHVKPDLLLIYAKPDERVLTLIRLGSHSELF